MLGLVEGGREGGAGLTPRQLHPHFLEKYTRTKFRAIFEVVQRKVKRTTG